MYNILVCDDDRDIRNALRIYLNGEGYGVLEVSNGKEALDKLASDDIHIVLMDIMMPLMDGMTATARIRQESNQHLVISRISGKDGTNDKENSKRSIVSCTEICGCDRSR